MWSISTICCVHTWFLAIITDYTNSFFWCCWASLSHSPNRQLFQLLEAALPLPLVTGDYHCLTTPHWTRKHNLNTAPRHQETPWHQTSDPDKRLRKLSRAHDTTFVLVRAHHSSYFSAQSTAAQLAEVLWTGAQLQRRSLNEMTR